MTATAKTGHMDARMRARRARVRADATRRRQRRTLSLFALLVVIAGVGIALRSPLFGISGIRVDGVQGARAQVVADVAALEQGQHLLTAPLAQAQARVEALPWVASAVVRRSPPSTVTIDVVPRVPLLTVQTPEAAWKIDEAAVLLDGGRVADAPTVILDDADLPKLGAPIDLAAVRDAVDVHRNVPQWLRNQIVAYQVSERYGLVLRLAVPTGDDGHTADEQSPANKTAVTPVDVRYGTASDLALKAEVIRVLLPQAIAAGGVLDVRTPATPVVVPPS